MAVQPMFASEKAAAKLLDTKPSDFHRLVKRGHLPPPRRIGDMERWDTSELHRIINADAMKEAFETLNWSIFLTFTEKRLKEKHTSIFGVQEN